MTRSMRLYSALLTVSLAILGGCGPSVSTPAAASPDEFNDPEPRVRESWSRPRHPSGSLHDVVARLKEADRLADSLILYRGLPHPDNEEKFRSARQSAPSLLLNGYLFYPEPIEIPDEQLQRIREAVCDAKMLYPYEPGDCGSFHPDVALEWRVGAERFRVLICFGCSDARVFGPAFSSINSFHFLRMKDALKGVYNAADEPMP